MTPIPTSTGTGAPRSPAAGNCDDNDASRFPGNSEVCDAAHHDEDCDPRPFGNRDADADGYPDDQCCNVDAEGTVRCGTDCDDLSPTAHPTENEVCNQVDDDCDGVTDEDAAVPLCRDNDGDGYGAGDSVRACAGTAGLSTLCNDCNDTNAALNPNGQVCAGPDAVAFCEGGQVTTASCDSGDGKSARVTQPNGSGVCVVKP